MFQIITNKPAIYYECSKERIREANSNEITRYLAKCLQISEKVLTFALDKR